MDPIYYCDTEPLTEEEVKKGEKIISTFNAIMDTVPDPKIKYMVFASESGFAFIFDFCNFPAKLNTSGPAPYAFFDSGTARIVRTVSDLKAMLAEWYSDTWHYSKHRHYGLEDFNGIEEVESMLTDAEKEEVKANVKIILSVM